MIEFKESAEFKDFIRKCDELDFETLKTGTEGKLIKFINESQITPYHTGYTQEHNEVLQEGRQKVLANTNIDYGARIYEYGPDNGSFIPSHDIKGSEKNINPRDHWFETEQIGLESAEDFVVRNIQMEVEDTLK